MVTLVPPDVGPVFGLTLVTVGNRAGSVLLCSVTISPRLGAPPSSTFRRPRSRAEPDAGPQQDRSVHCCSATLSISSRRGAKRSRRASGAAAGNAGPKSPPLYPGAEAAFA